MQDNSKIEFEIICEDILNNDKFKKLNSELHHGITRYDHSLRVAKTTYKITKFLHLKNYKDTTRAALLHDFYLNSQMVESNSKERLSLHPDLALENAKKYYSLNSMQEDIIKNHMFPVTKYFPKTKEGVLVSLTDKCVATYEMCHFKVSMQLSILLIFLFNLVNLQK